MSEPQIQLTVEYRDIQGFPGYKVGSDGSVLTSLKVIHIKGGRRGETVTASSGVWRPISHWTDRKGYCNVSLRNGGRKHNKLVHRLVLEAFIGPCPSGMECRHFPDRSPSNNSVDNLLWGTQSENSADKMLHGTDLRGERHPSSRLKDEHIREIFFLRAAGWTQKRLAEKLGVSRSMIGRILCRKAWSHIK